MYYPEADFNNWDCTKCDYCGKFTSCTMAEWDMQCDACLSYNYGE